MEIRCLADGNPSPTSASSSRCGALCSGWRRACRSGWRSALITQPSSQNLNTREMEEEGQDDNGVLVLGPAQKEHSGRYECQGLDLGHDIAAEATNRSWW